MFLTTLRAYLGFRSLELVAYPSGPFAGVGERLAYHASFGFRCGDGVYLTYFGVDDGVSGELESTRSVAEQCSVSLPPASSATASSPAEIPTAISPAASQQLQAQAQAPDAGYSVDNEADS